MWHVVHNTFLICVSLPLRNVTFNSASQKLVVCTVVRLLAGCYNAFVDSECEARVTLGECDSNREWMMDNCFRACTRCYTAGTSPRRSAFTSSDVQ